MPAAQHSSASEAVAVSRHDVIVVGAGMAGLSAALGLAAAGRSVLVIDALGEPGGKMGNVVVDGVEFDTGPSVLTLPEVVDAVLERARSARRVRLVRPAPAFRYHFPSGKVLDVFVNVDETLASVRDALGAPAADELRAFLRYARRIWDASKDAFVFSSAPTLVSLVGLFLRRPRDLLAVDAWRSMADAVEARICSPELRLLLLRYATYNGSNPYQAPATLHCIAHVELALGGFGVAGGMATLARTLVEAARDLGVSFQMETPVRRLLHENARMVGVQTAHSTHHATTVVVNADVAHLWETLLPTPRRAHKSSQPSMSGATAVLRAARSASRPAHAVLFPDDYRAEFEDIFARGKSPRDPTVYLCAQEKAHERVGWRDDEPVFCMVNAPPCDAPGEATGNDDSAAALERGLARARQAGLIRDSDAVVWQRSAADLARVFPGTHGALYGASSNSRLSAFTRPPNVVASHAGLYLASGSVHPGGGVPLCLQSGLLAADAALARGG